MRLLLSSLFLVVACQDNNQPPVVPKSPPITSDAAAGSADSMRNGPAATACEPPSGGQCGNGCELVGEKCVRARVIVPPQ